MKVNSLLSRPGEMMEYRRWGGSLKFGRDGLAEFVYYELMGNEDESIGSVDFGFEARFGKRILCEDTMGNVWLVRAENEKEAIEAYEAFEEAYMASCLEEEEEG